MKHVVILFLSVVMLGQVSRGDVRYQTPLQTAKGMVKFSIPYTFGVHEGTVSLLQGSVHTSDSDEVLDAHFQVPIEAMSTGNSLRDCHMREAMGLDYSQSHFPKEHVCERSNVVLPAEGVDSVKFPLVTVDFVKMASTAPLTPGVPTAVAMTLNVEVHGVAKSFQAEHVVITKILSEKGTPAFRITTKLNLSLKDFNIQVKAFKLGFVSINVEDHVTIDIDTTVAIAE